MMKSSKASPPSKRGQSQSGFGNSTFQSQAANNTYGSKMNLNETLSVIKFQKEHEGKRSPFKITSNQRVAAMKPYQSKLALVRKESTYQ